MTGDFNGDGRLDLAVANVGSNDVSVLLGNGNGTFRPQVTYAVGSDPIALVTGDFNGDGRTDLAVANFGSNDVSVLLGNGDGTFGSQVTYAVGSDPIALVTGDFLGDGRTDLAVDQRIGQRRFGTPGQRRRHLPAPGDLRGGTASRPPWWRATSTATAGSTWPSPTPSPATYRVVAERGRHVRHRRAVVTTLQATPIVADLTGDGVDDVFVVDGAGDILWRRGRPQEPGSFDPPITINLGHPSRDIVAVDTDQGPVLASVDATDNAVSLYAWRGGSFALIGSLPTGLLPAQIVDGGPQRRRPGRPGGAERGRRHPLGLFQHRQRRAARPPPHRPRSSLR